MTACHNHNMLTPHADRLVSFHTPPLPLTTPSLSPLTTPRSLEKILDPNTDWPRKTKVRACRESVYHSVLNDPSPRYSIMPPRRPEFDEHGEAQGCTAAGNPGTQSTGMQLPERCVAIR